MKAYKDMRIIGDRNSQEFLSLIDICSRSKMKVKGRSGPATGFRKIRVPNYGLFYAPAWCAKPVNRIHPSMMCEQMLDDSASASSYIMGSGTDMSEPPCRPAKYTECLSSRCMYVRGPYHGVAMSRYIRRFMKIYMCGPELNTVYTRLHKILYDSYDMYSARWHKGNDKNE